MNVDMTRSLSALDAQLAEADVDGYLIRASGTDASQRYLAEFTAPDPFTTLYTAEGDLQLLVSSLEYARARREAAGEVSRPSEYDAGSLRQQYGSREGRARALKAWLADNGVASVSVPASFPVGLADELRDLAVSVAPDSGATLEKVRAIKTETEIDSIRAAQAANEHAMAVAAELFETCTIDSDGGLLLDDAALTSERVQQRIEIALLERGHALDETIVACGAQAADPHERGHGQLTAGAPIIVDIFPRSKSTGYYADMTRTFVVGEPSESITEWHTLTQRALGAALETIEAGVTGAAVHAAACEIYEEAGLPTLRADSDTETGFIHSTGHGIGLDIHEHPRLAPGSGELEAGMVVTVEPGLYDPAVGGVRIEDLVVVREDGVENLTEYPQTLTL